VVMEVMEKQKHQSFLEPIWQLLVNKRYELAVEKLSTTVKWNSGNEIHPSERHPSESENLKLQFLGSISPLVFTGISIAGEKNTLQVALVNAVTGKVVTSGPEASAKVEIVVVDGDFDVDEGGSWPLEDFNSKIVGGKEGKKSQLAGNPHLNLKDGIGSVDTISVKHTSAWWRRGEFRLGARVVGHSSGIRIREAKTEPFIVKDRRGMSKKLYTQSLSDEVWRLENIGKGGPFHQRLTKENIITVKDFLTQFFLNPERLREILGKRMPDTRWETTVNHAKKCKRDTKTYLYYPPSSQPKIGVVFDCVGQVMGLYSESESLHVPVDKLSETQKAHALELVVSAFKHRVDVIPIDDYTSLTQRSLPSSEGVHPNNSNDPDWPNVYDFGTSAMNGAYNPTNPGTSFQGSIVPTFPSWPTNSPGVHGLQNTGNMAPDTGTNFSSYDTVPLHSDGDIDNLLNFPNSDLELVENHGLESLADQQTVHAAVVPSEDPAEMGR
ncbi:unnamed protein product, partial [Ilex paraguariensis]